MPNMRPKGFPSVGKFVGFFRFRMVFGSKPRTLCVGDVVVGGDAKLGFCGGNGGGIDIGSTELKAKSAANAAQAA